MLMIDNIKNFLYDKNYYINIYDNCIHVFNYLKIKDFKESLIILKMPNFNITIHGHKLFISKMLKNELLITGEYTSLEKTYD